MRTHRPNETKSRQLRALKERAFESPTARNLRVAKRQPKAKQDLVVTTIRIPTALHRAIRLHLLSEENHRKNRSFNSLVERLLWDVLENEGVGI